MRTTKSFINAVNASLANANVHYSSMWKVAEMQDTRNQHKTYAAVVYVCERIDSEPEFWIYYNFDIMGNTVRHTTRKTSKEAEEEFANTLI